MPTAIRAASAIAAWRPLAACACRSSAACRWISSASMCRALPPSAVRVGDWVELIGATISARRSGGRRRHHLLRDTHAVRGAASHANMSAQTTRRASVTEFESMTNVDGAITPTAEARVPVLDRGFLYGDSIYEVFRTYDGVPLFYEEHWARFENSAALIRMRIGLSLERLTAEPSARRSARAARRGCVATSTCATSSRAAKAPSICPRRRSPDALRDHRARRAVLDARATTRAASPQRSQALGAIPRPRSTPTSRAATT